MQYFAETLPDGSVARVMPVVDTVADPQAHAEGVLGVPLVPCGDGVPMASPGWIEWAGGFYRPWVPVAGADTGPEDAESGYRKGAAVWRDGHAWTSAADNNVQTPGVALWWRADGTLIPPTGSEDAYPPGHEGQVEGVWYRWAGQQPAVFLPGQPGGESWVQITGPGGDPVTPPEPEGPILWAPDIVFAVDDLTTHEGVTYRIVQAHTSAGHWLPADLPSLYEVVAGG